MSRTARAIGRAEPLAHDALTAEPASLTKHDRAILLEILIEHDAQMRAAQLGEQPLALLDRLPPQILAVELEQVECTMHGSSESAVAADQFKNRKPGLVADNRLSIDQAGAKPAACQRPSR